MNILSWHLAQPWALAKVSGIAPSPDCKENSMWAGMGQNGVSMVVEYSRSNN
jgi:hypothetical protein